MLNLWSNEIKMDNATPLYAQLETILLRHLRESGLKPGAPLPSEGEFCTRFGLSRTTVRQAFKGLEQKGLVVRRRGLGSFVAAPKVSRHLDYLYSFTSQLSDMGYQTSSKVLSFLETVADGPLLAETGLEQDTPVYVIERLRLANDLPMLLEKTVLVRALCPVLTPQMLETQSLYSLLVEYGLSIDSATESYEPVLMDKKTQQLLQCTANPCAFRICRKSRTVQGEVFEVTQSYMPGQNSRLEITLRKDSISLQKYEK